MIYVYFYESIFQDKSIHIIFIFAKLIWKMIYVYFDDLYF
jgi:hypothetical protein